MPRRRVSQIDRRLPPVVPIAITSARPLSAAKIDFIWDDFARGCALPVCQVRVKLLPFLPIDRVHKNVQNVWIGRGEPLSYTPVHALFPLLYVIDSVVSIVLHAFEIGKCIFFNSTQTRATNVAFNQLKCRFLSTVSWICIRRFRQIIHRYIYVFPSSQTLSNVICLKSP